MLESVTLENRGRLPLARYDEHDLELSDESIQN